MCYISHSIPPPPLHPHTHSHNVATVTPRPHPPILSPPPILHPPQPPPTHTHTHTHTLLPCTGVVCRTSFFSILMHGLQVTMCVCETAMAAVSIAVHWCRVNLSWLLLVHRVSPLCCVDLRLRAQTAVYNVRV